MPEKGLGSPIARNLVMFLISMLLVIGFWGHANFYSLGLVPLIFLGGGLTFVVLKAITWANGSTGMGRRPAGTLLFSPDEVKGVLYGTKTILIRPLRKTRMRAGSLYEAKLSVASGRSFALLHITDVHRVRLGGLTEQEAVHDGAGSLPELRRRWESAYGRWDPSEIARVIEFRALRPLRMD